IALRAFLKFLAKNKIQSIAPDQIELAKVGDRELDLISEKDLKQILTAPERKFKNKLEILERKEGKRKKIGRIT
ncbi:MAG: hypothetical protein RIS64_3867, partial [Bacteroidota bacterium]